MLTSPYIYKIKKKPQISQKAIDIHYQAPIINFCITFNLNYDKPKIVNLDNCRRADLLLRVNHCLTDSQYKIIHYKILDSAIKHLQECNPNRIFTLNQG